MILFDLPLNPDLLEQRIGRLDRIGQTDTVHLHVPGIEGSGQQRLMQWYDKGLDAFSHVCSTGHHVYAAVKAELKEALIDHSAQDDFDALIAKTNALMQQSINEMHAGRDLMLELNSCKKDEAQAIIDAAIPEEIAALDYQHVAGPERVYYRFSNPLGREKDGGEEDLAAEIEFQLEKKRLGLSRIETFATDDATDFEPEEVELYDAAQQYEEDNLSDDDDDDNGGSRPLFSLSLPSFPNPFARFKTDNLLRKHTLIPVGSKEKIEKENGK